MKWLFILSLIVPCLLSSKPKGERIFYVLLDRNSPGVWYQEEMKDTTFTKIIKRDWYVNQMHDTLRRHMEGIHFEFDPTEEFPDMITRKHRSFLDVVRYKTEDWVRDSFPENSKFIRRDIRVYLLDESTIKNDSIVIYRTSAGKVLSDYD